MSKTKQLLEDLQDRMAQEMEADMNAQVLRAIMLGYDYPYYCDIHVIDILGSISDWAEETIGARGATWEYADGTYYFKQQRDLDFFILRWLQK